MLFELEAIPEASEDFTSKLPCCRDYLLTQQVERRRFGIVRGGVYTTNRRFKKMGHIARGLAVFLKTAMNYWNPELLFARSQILADVSLGSTARSSNRFFSEATGKTGSSGLAGSCLCECNRHLQRTVS